MNKSVRFDFSYKVMMYINVFYSNVKLRILSQSNSFLIVSLNYNCLKSL